MKLLVLLFAMILAFPVASADNDKKHAGAVVVVDAYGETVGRVVQLWPHGTARIFMHIDGENALVWLNREFMGMSAPSEGPMLFFEDPGCEGQAYARPDHVDGGWLQPRLVIVPGFVPEGEDPSFERIPYFATAPGPDTYYPKSHLSQEGWCLSFEPDDVFAWPVRKMNACRFSHDLHTCYPPPYELAR